MWSIRIVLDALYPSFLEGRSPIRRRGTGRASFELARAFERVVGIDFSARFIQAGVKLAETGVLRYTMPDEGELVTYHERRLDALGLAGTAGRVEFWQADSGLKR